MRAMIRRGFAQTRRFWERVLREHSTPRELGLAVAVGVFSGCTPFLGFHIWIALGLATLLRVNRLWAMAGSRVSILPVFVWVSFCEIETVHRLRTGAWAALAPAQIVAHGTDLLADWLLGAALVGGGLAALAGALAYGVANRWQKRVRPRTPDESPPSSSESPP
jgi:uncharacterized protein (DUF2062 family)